MSKYKFIQKLDFKNEIPKQNSHIKFKITIQTNLHGIFINDFFV